MSEILFSKSIEIKSELKNLNLVEEFLNDYCEELSVGEELYGNMLISTSEAVNNAIIHGNSLNRDYSVFIDFYEHEGDYQISVSDQGNGFNYNNLPDPTSPENIEKENGRGIFLIKALSDNVEFNDLGNSIKIYFSK